MVQSHRKPNGRRLVRVGPALSSAAIGSRCWYFMPPHMLASIHNLPTQRCFGKNHPCLTPFPLLRKTQVTVLRTSSIGMLSAALPLPCATCSILVMFQIAATQRLRMLVVPTRQRSSSARITWRQGWFRRETVAGLRSASEIHIFACAVGAFAQSSIRTMGSVQISEGISSECFSHGDDAKLRTLIGLRSAR